MLCKCVAQRCALSILTLCDSAKRNSETSPLLRLPREIRDKIWEEVLANRILKPFYFGRKKRPDHYCTVSGSKMNLGLLLTCRQVYSETALLPFEGNIFAFQGITLALNDVRKIKKVYRGYIRHIQICIDHHRSQRQQVADLRKIGSMFPGLSSIRIEYEWYTEMYKNEDLYVRYMQIQLDMAAKQFSQLPIQAVSSSYPHLAQKLVMPTQGAR